MVGIESTAARRASVPDTDERAHRYETVNGIMERVIVPVELRLGSIEGAMDWKKDSVQGAKDPYYQALGRDEVRLLEGRIGEGEMGKSHQTLECSFHPAFWSGLVCSIGAPLASRRSDTTRALACTTHKT